MQIRINLSQHQYQRRLTVGLFWVVILGLAFGLAFYNCELIYYYNRQLAGLNERNENLKAELEEVRQIVGENGLSEGELAALFKRVDYVNVLIEKQAFSWTWLIYRLEECTPDEISITEIMPSFAESNIKIVGLGKTVDDIARFVSNLQASNCFEDVFLLEHSDTEIEKNNLIKFVITSKYVKT